MKNFLSSSIVDHMKNIREGITKMDEIKQEVQLLKRYSTMIDQSKPFTMKTKELQIRQVALNPGERAANCVICNRTCQYPCKIANDCDLNTCPVMHNGNCTKCGCHWSNHHNMPYRYEECEVERVLTRDDMSKMYGNSKPKNSTQDMIERAQNDYKQVWEKTFYHLTKCKECVGCYQKISSIPISSEIDFTKNQIEGEKQRRQPGWESKVKELNELLERQKFIEEVSQNKIIMPSQNVT